MNMIIAALAAVLLLAPDRITSLLTQVWSKISKGGESVVDSVRGDSTDDKHSYGSSRDVEALQALRERADKLKNDRFDEGLSICEQNFFRFEGDDEVTV